jgi:hypothetical protein
MNKRNIAIGVVILIVAIGAAWAFGFIGGTDPAVAELQQMRDQMSVANLPDAERDQLRDQFRQRLEGLSDSQRRAVFAGGREQWQQRNQQRMDEFFAMSRPDQQKRLDESINRMLERQKGQNQNGGNRDARNGGRGGNRGAGMTPAQREARAKQRLDNSSPKERAQRAEFRRRMQERMQQRGINSNLLPGPGRRMA